MQLCVPSLLVQLMYVLQNLAGGVVLPKLMQILKIQQFDVRLG